MEAFILYFVLFFPGIYASPSPDWLAQGIETVRVVPFSAVRELGRTLTYTLPALALILYLIHRTQQQHALLHSPEGVVSLKRAMPGKKDILPFVISLPALIIIGLFVSFLVSLSPQTVPPSLIEGPYNLPGWIVMVLACLGIGYLEEVYFRYYLLTRLENIVPSPVIRVILSTVLFALCHVYEGYWGMLNAAIAGVFLGVIFLRFRSIHGVALAHAGYNMFVYTMGTM